MAHCIALRLKKIIDVKNKLVWLNEYAEYIDDEKNS